MKLFRLNVILLLSLFALFSGPARAESGNPFPIYDGIKANVDFWTQIYSKYTTRQIIIHDTDNLARIYGVVDIPSHINPYSRAGRAWSKTQKANFRDLLLKFAAGEKPQTDEEWKIFRYFAIDNTPKDFQDAANNIRGQLGQADRFKEGVIRSGLYLDHIRKVFAEYNLPADLVYLPHVESSFDYTAYSKLGAAGIWQFIRSTGRLFMKINYLVDERRDPITATVAAARLLQRNYEGLKNWPLAITAYNHGLEGMQSAVRQLGTNNYMQVFYNHDGRRFGFASKNFYSEFLAAVSVAKNYQKHFGDIKVLEPIRFAELEVPPRTDLSTLIRHLGVDKETFTSLNLAFRPVAYREGRPVPQGYRIRLPYRSDVDYGAKLASLGSDKKGAPEVAAVAANDAPPSTADWIQVQHGDSLWTISQQLNIPMQQLIDFNELENNRIHAGQILKIPTRGGKIEPTTETQVAAVEPTPTATPTPAAKIQPAPAVVETKPVAVSMTESPTESAPVVAPEKKEVLVAALETPKAEPVKPPVPKQVELTGPPAPEAKVWHGLYAVTDIQGDGAEMTGVVTLEPEETLGHLADWLNVPTQKIRVLNGFSFTRQVQLGEKLRVPLVKVAAVDFEKQRLEYHRGIQEDFYNSFKIEGVETYKVKKGDNIWELSKTTLEVPVWLLREYNPAKSLASMTVGDEIQYPVVVPKK